MATAFVSQLPRVPSSALPSDANCLICVQPYENLTTESGSFERAVALPCSAKHVFGSECLSQWLTLWKNCPLCRRPITLPIAAERQLEHKHTWRTMVDDQKNWEEYWYRNFWILHLRGDRAVEREWRQWQQDWIWAAEQWDEGCQAQAKAALSLSPLRALVGKMNPNQIRKCAAGIQTVRFREYRLFLRFQADAGEHPELKAPPGFQLTPAQEDELFHELVRRQAFGHESVRPPRLNKRDSFHKLRNIGLVWDPDCGIPESKYPGSWTQYAY